VAAAHFNRGVVLSALERHREALESYDRATALEPGYMPARANAILTAMNLCNWARLEAISPDQAAMLTPPLTFLGLSSDKRLQGACAAAATRSLVPALPPPLWDGRRYGHDRIRLAYVSADFREHAVAFQIAPLIEGHDRNRFQVIGIATGPGDGSAIHARLVKGFDRFHDFAGLNSDEIARRLREMEIDIAVDLGGHTGLNRLQIFAHRPAPVQAGWLGFPGTSGAPFLDYLIADAVVAPDAHQPFYSERLVHLPDTYFSTDPEREIGVMPARADEGLPAEGFVFCAFNNAWKITLPVFDIWMRLMAAVPGSVLWLRQPAADTRATLEKEAAARGIAPQRLVFAKDAPLDIHLARHRLADLFLDTLPYNAHATAVDALWAGLPLLTCKGDAFAGRVAASLLSAIGLPELVTENLADYHALALALAQGPARLKTLKEKLAGNRTSAPLFDAGRFRRGIEEAYVRMMDAR
jgi:predicted O-linked N-acetylglucosamine transferase (SPINDLY family)